MKWHVKNAAFFISTERTYRLQYSQKLLEFSVFGFSFQFFIHREKLRKQENPKAENRLIFTVFSLSETRKPETKNENSRFLLKWDPPSSDPIIVWYRVTPFGVTHVTTSLCTVQCTVFYQIKINALVPLVGERTQTFGTSNKLHTIACKRDGQNDRCSSLKQDSPER